MADDGATDPGELTVHRVFEQIVDEDPSRVAARHDGEELTYGEADRRANGVAHALIAAGAGPGRCVVISGGHDHHTCVSMFGVLKAGAAFVVLDAADPPERRRAIAERVEPAAVIETGADGCDVGWLDLDVPTIRLADTVPTGDRPSVDVSPDDAVWVLFTSGTSGEPKGVPGTNLSVLRPGVPQNNPASPGDVSLVLGRLCWLAGVSAVFRAWLAGATLEFHDVVANGTSGLAGRIEQLGLRSIGLVPTLARSLFGGLADGEVLETLDRVSFFGEQLWWSDLRLVAEHVRPDCRFGNSLASSETRGICRIEIPAAEVGDEQGPVPVGPVSAHWRHRIVDSAGVEVEPGTAGQLVVSTETLFPGYFNDDALNARRWEVDDEGRRWFATGDMVIERPDGLLVHAGRADFQMKINGVLVAPEEAESLLAATEGVVEAAVVGVSDRKRRHRLVAHVVTDVDGPSPDELEARLRRSLPAPLVPSDIRSRTSELPRLANGKVDRSRLSAESARPRCGKGGPPQGDLEASLVAAVAEIVDLEGVGRDDDYWALGGDSLGAVELIARIEDEHGVRLPLMAVAESPTPARLAERLSTGGSGTDDVVRLADGDGMPVVMVPGAGGTALRFTRLADGLGARPVVTLEHAGSQRRGLPSRSVGAAADRVIRLLDRVEGEELVLLGYSYGAHVAYEAARRLEASGAAPPLVVLLDAAPTAPPPELRRPWEQDEPPGSRQDRGGAARARLRQVGWLKRLVFWARANTAGLDRPGTHQHHKRLELLARRASMRYSPGTYGGRVLLVRSDRWRVADRTLGWGALATVDVVEVRGDHNLLPLLPEVADAVRQAVEELESGASVHAEVA